MATTIKWPGKSGKTYTYGIYPLGTNFKHEPGNYVYARESTPGKWRSVYFGQTDNLGARLANHEKEACAIRHGATHVHVHLNSKGELVRLAEETDLISKWSPPCNVQGK